MTRIIHGVEVQGIGLDGETRCEHWHGDLDIIAIKFKCCELWYPCSDCHSAIAGHTAEVWSTGEFAETAILCGACGNQFAIDDYLGCGSICPKCERGFNPGCAKHYHLYFERSASTGAFRNKL